MSVRTRPPVRAGHTRGSLAWQPLQWPEEGLEAVPGLEFGSTPGRGRVIALRATSGARAGGWAARAAVAIAGAGVAQGARVLLADLFLDQPHLHEAFGARNLEGVSDVVAYGASLGRIARAGDDGAFRVATAGTPVADAGTLLDHPRWRHLVESLLADGITLVAYQPAESVVPPAGTPSIVLARKGEPMSALGNTGLRHTLAVLGPPQGASAAAVGSGGARTLAEQGYRALPWEAVGDDGTSGDEPSRGDASGTEAEAEPPSEPSAEDQAVELDAAEPPPAAQHSGAEAAVPSADIADASAAPGPAGSGVARGSTGRDSGVRGRGLSISAFAVLLLFAVLMILMGINNAGIAEVPGADRVWERFESVLARISGFFAR